LLILPIVFPKANGTDFVLTAAMQRLEVAAWATVRLMIAPFRDRFSELSHVDS
jgi:hypothetical protein